MEITGTPRSRPALKFANRAYTSSPQSAAKRLSTPQGSARKTTRFDESSMSRSTSSGNLFRASMASAAGPTRFEATGSLSGFKKSATTANLVSTPDTTKRVYRETIAKFTPRGLAAHTGTKELFDMRIPSPPPELSGEELTKRVPRDMERKGAVYADQYLSHIVPKDFDEAQRRQFFCILDLRRLKYAANDVFTSRDWKLNIMNFAREFEKSRSLILLRYGLYEFQNIKPSNDVLRRWKQAHGLPIDEEEAANAPLKPQGSTGSKRKATEDIAPASATSSSKRRLFTDDSAPATSTSTYKKPVAEDLPQKIAKPAGSATRNLFEQAANKSSAIKDISTTPANPFISSSAPALKANPFAAAAAKPSTESESEDEDNDLPVPKAESVADEQLERPRGSSVFRSMKEAYNVTAPLTSANIASDQVEKTADESSLKKTWTTDTPIKFAPSAPAPGAGLFGSSSMPAAPVAATASAPTASSLFGAKPAASTDSSAPATATATSLFGAQKPETEKASPPSSLFGAKPAAEAPKISLFGASSAAPAASSTAPATSSASSLFGAKTEPAAPATSASSLFGSAAPAFTATTPTAPAPSLFSAKPTGTESTTPAAPPAANLFAAAAAASKPATSSSGSNLFGAPKADAPASTGSGLFGSTPAPTSNLFAAAPAASTSGSSLFGATPAAEKPSTTSNLFGAKKEDTPSVSLFAPKKEDTPASSIFGSTPAAAPATTSSSSLFGASTSAAPAASTGGLFGSKPSLAPPATFSFGATPAAPAEPKSLFSAPPLDGSPMKQDSPTKRVSGDDSMQDSPPAGKKLFGVTSAMPSGPGFSFGQTNSASPAPTAAPTFSFGSQPAANAGGSSLFGASTTNNNSGFSFGANSTAPAAPSTSFTFGSGASAPAPAAAPAAPSFNFGGASSATSGAVPSFNFGGAPSGAGGASGTSTPSSSFTFGAGGAGGNSQDSNAGASNMFSFNAAASNSGTGSRPAGPPRKMLMPKSLRGRSNSPAVPQNTALPNPFANGPTASFNFGGNGTNGDENSATSFRTDDTKTSDADVKAGTKRMKEDDDEKDEVSNKKTVTSLFGGKTEDSKTSSLFGSTTASGEAPKVSLFGASSEAPKTSLFGSTTTETPKISLFGSAPKTTSLFGTATTASSPATAEAPKTSLFGSASTTAAASPAAAPTPTTANAEDGDAEAPQEQLNLTEGGPGEEDEEILHEVRAKISKMVKQEDGSSKWDTQGLGPLRVLKHKTKGTVRMLLRREPTGQVAFNRSVLPSNSYSSTAKSVRLVTSGESGLETWLVQVKTAEAAASFASALEEHKGCNKKE